MVGYIKTDFKKVVRLWTAFKWLRTVSSIGVFWIQQWKL